MDDYYYRIEDCIDPEVPECPECVEFGKEVQDLITEVLMTLEDENLSEGGRAFFAKKTLDKWAKKWL
jgi:hypothetical protein